jgi:hypothetical protein
LRAWVEIEHLVLLNHEYASASTRFSLDSVACTRAGQELALIFPNLYNRFGDSDSRRAFRAAKGLLIQENVSDWFRRTWGDKIWRPSSSAGRYDGPAVDDFNLLYEGRLRSVDVKGVNGDGTVRNFNGSSAAHIYVFAEVDGPYCQLLGWCQRHEYGTFEDPRQSRAMSQLFVRLNCAADGVDYYAMRRCVSAS